MAVGGYANDGSGNRAGHGRIYEYANNVWIQKGSEINGESATEQSGWSVSLSSDGGSVAIG